MTTDTAAPRTAPGPFAFSELSHVIEDLETRAKSLERGALASLCLLVCSIIIGFAVFVLAGTIASLEQVSYYREAKAIELSLFDNKNALDELINKGKATTPNDAAGIKADIVKISARIDDIGSSLKLFINSASNSASASEDANRRLLISSITTRISAASLLAFIVVVLINLYRYNVRLAAFYISRADTLKLIGQYDAKAIEQISKFLSPDKLDIDKMPDLPTKQVIDLLKQVTVVAKGK